MTRESGMFPFNRWNTTRPMREADGQAGVLVVGVCASARHVAWTAPAHLNQNQPYGHEKTGERRQIGSVVAPAVSSRKKAKQLHLAPLRIGPAEAAFTGIYPTFVVRHPGERQRGQDWSCAGGPAHIARPS